MSKTAASDDTPAGSSTVLLLESCVVKRHTRMYASCAALANNTSAPIDSSQDAKASPRTQSSWPDRDVANTNCIIQHKHT